MNHSYLGALLASLPFCTQAMAATAPSYAIIDLGESDYVGRGMSWGDRAIQDSNPSWPQAAPCTGSNHSYTVTPWLLSQSFTVAPGVTCTPTGAHAAVWKFTPDMATPGFTDVGVLPGALTDASAAIGTNEVGDVVGASDTAYSGANNGAGPASHAYLWNSGRMTDLGSIAGPHYNSHAVAVNDWHEVIGITDTLSSASGALLQRAFVYTNGQMYNLTFHTTSGATALLYEALWIDCQGNIATYGFPANLPGVRHAYLLVRQGPARTCPNY